MSELLARHEPSRRGAHHEAAVYGLIQAYTCLGSVHVRYDLLRIEQNYPILGQES
jgi:hypothetical protein